MCMVAIASPAAKSEAADTPLEIPVPPELNRLHEEQFDQRNENSQNVSAFARFVAFDEALPTVNPFAATWPVGAAVESDGTG